MWPDSDDIQALKNLKRTLTDLRKSLGSAAILLQSPAKHLLQFSLAPSNADLLAFDEAIREGTTESLQRAVLLYTGPLLEDCYEIWAGEEQESHKEAFFSAVERLAGQEMDASKPGAHISLLRRAIRMEPSREHLTRLLMTSLAQIGDIVAATEAYRALRTVLLDEHNIAPAADIAALNATLLRRPESVVHAPVQPRISPAPTHKEAGRALP